jgi:hypothetical protein
LVPVGALRDLPEPVGAWLDRDEVSLIAKMKERAALAIRLPLWSILARILDERMR